MKYYQGETVNFTVELDGANVSDFDYIDVYLYTEKSSTWKFTTNENKLSKAEYFRMSKISGTMLQGVLSSTMTSQMLGVVWLEIRCVRNDMPVFVKRMQTDMAICKTTIKNEDYYG